MVPSPGQSPGGAAGAAGSAAAAGQAPAPAPLHAAGAGLSWWVALIIALMAAALLALAGAMGFILLRRRRKRRRNAALPLQGVLTVIARPRHLPCCFFCTSCKLLPPFFSSFFCPKSVGGTEARQLLRIRKQQAPTASG